MVGCAVCLESLQSAAPSCAVEILDNQIRPLNKSKRIRKFAQNDLMVICATTCGHVFHRVCLVSRWMERERNNTCPVCLKRLGKRKIFRLFVELENPITDEILRKELEDMKKQFVEKTIENNLLKIKNAKLRIQCSSLNAKLASAAATKKIGRCTLT